MRNSNLLLANRVKSLLGNLQKPHFIIMMDSQPTFLQERAVQFLITVKLSLTTNLDQKALQKIKLKTKPRKWTWSALDLHL